MTYPPGTRIVYRDLRIALPARARAIDSGFATFGCHADPLGVKPQIYVIPDDDVFHTATSTVHYINGSERWDIDPSGPTDLMDTEDWIMVKVSGPFRAEIGGQGIRILCDCGWSGPWRSMDRRVLLKDWEHACLGQGELIPDV